MSLAYSVGHKTISIYHDGDLLQVEHTHPNWKRVLEELRKPDDQKDVPLILELADLPKFVAIASKGRVEVSHNEVRFSGTVVSGYMVDRMLAMLGDGQEVESWAAFMDNLMDNPLPEVREDLFKWMEKGKMPITPDGCIIAFKKVRANYMDVHTGRFSNAVGAVLEMDRALCDTNRNNTCSTGFHFCSADYLGNFGGERVMVVKINPRDVTAIPTDYNLTKARCCKYVVTGELKDTAAARHDVWRKNVVNPEDPRELPHVMLPRKGKALKDLPHDPARVSGPPPIDDWGDSAAPAAKAAESKKAKKTAPSAQTPAKKSRAKKPKSSPPEPAEAPNKKPRAKKAEAKPAAQTQATEVQPEAPAAAPAAPTFTSKGQHFTGDQILSEYEESGRNRTKLSAKLNVPKTTLLGWLRKLGL